MSVTSMYSLFEIPRLPRICQEFSEQQPLLYGSGGFVGGFEAYLFASRSVLGAKKLI